MYLTVSKQAIYELVFLVLHIFIVVPSGGIGKHTCVHAPVALFAFL